MNQGMLCETVSSGSLPHISHEAESTRSGPSQFAHSNLSAEELQVSWALSSIKYQIYIQALTDRIVKNPLLQPEQFEDRFTNPALDKRDESQYCIATLPAYVQVRLANQPSAEPVHPIESGFEQQLLPSPTTKARPSFRKLIVQNVWVNSSN
jgi:hypothetical protein